LHQDGNKYFKKHQNNFYEALTHIEGVTDKESQRGELVSG